MGAVAVSTVITFLANRRNISTVKYPSGCYPHVERGGGVTLDTSAFASATDRAHVNMIESASSGLCSPRA